MKQSLQLRTSQHLALTPQLQQSIRLLQLSTLELHQELEQLLTDNPLLERLDDPLDRSVRLLADGAISSDRHPATAPESARAEQPPAADAEPAYEGGDTEGASGAERLDWDAGRSKAPDDEDSRPQLEASHQSLREHLMEQMRTDRAGSTRPRAGRTDHRRARRQRLPRREPGRNPRAPAGRTGDRDRRAADRARAAAKLGPDRRGRAQRIRVPGAADPAHARRADGHAAHGPVHR
jgi:hypothetical protein